MSITGWLTDLRLGIPTRASTRRAAHSAYMGDGVALCRIMNRYKLYVPTQDISLAPHLMLDGRWDPWMTRIMTRAIRPGMHVADIGANLGYFTMLMADLVGAQGHVHAFEPNPVLVPLVRRSVAVNDYRPRVTVHDFALGDQDGREMLFVVPGDEWGGAAVWTPREDAVPNSAPIQIRRLDTVPGADRIAVAKIDAEGLEPEIWAGMAGLLAGDALRTVLIEFTGGHYADPAGFVEQMRGHGFRFALVDSVRGPQPITPEAVAALPPHVARNLVLER